MLTNHRGVMFVYDAEKAKKATERYSLAGATLGEYKVACPSFWASPSNENFVGFAG